MGKTNYTKVENALNDGLLKIKVADLLGKAEATESETIEKQKLLAAIIFEVNHSKDKNLFKSGGMTRKALRTLLEKHGGLSPEEWTALKEFHNKVELYKKEILSRQSPEADEQLIDAERKRHINKRYNTQEKWLPLH